MNYIIYLRDKSQIEISENDYNNISNFLGQLKLFKLENGEIINAVDISRIKPIVKQQIIPKEFRLNETTQGNEKEVRVLGGVQKIDIRKRMIQLFQQIKGSEGFTQFKDYSEWEKEHYRV